MYFPYMRSNLNEISAILELSQVVVESRLVLPVFRIEKPDRHLSRRLKLIAKQGQRYAVIVNTAPVDAGKAIQRMVQDLVGEHPGIVVPAFEIFSNEVNALAVRAVPLFRESPAILVHRTAAPVSDIDRAFAPLRHPPIHIYLQQSVGQARAHHLPSSGDVILNDPFKKKVKNGLYPQQSEFESLEDTYRSNGYAGFGDFGIIGDYYKAGGGRASNVALHLTEKLPGRFVCNHFVSDDKFIESHIHYQYADALAKLRTHVRAPPLAIFNTSGIIDGYAVDGDFHNLGVAKRWSMKHHIHMLHNILSSAKVQPFV